MPRIFLQDSPTLVISTICTQVITRQVMWWSLDGKMSSMESLKQANHWIPAKSTASENVTRRNWLNEKRSANETTKWFAWFSINMNFVQQIKQSCKINNHKWIIEGYSLKRSISKYQLWLAVNCFSSLLFIQLVLHA